ncbi:hypothetical protein GOODEAATRI_032587, partial [Goodea atripinnis]
GLVPACISHVCDRDAGVRFMWGTSTEFQSLEDQRDPFPDPRDQEGDPLSIGGNDGSGNSLGSSVSSGRGEEPCPLRAIILAALAKVDLDDAPVANRKPVFSPGSGGPSVRGATIAGLLGRASAPLEGS